MRPAASGFGSSRSKPASSGSATKPCSEPVHFARECQRNTLELLVVLEFDGIETGELDSDGRGARDAGRGVVVSDVHLLHVTAGDHVALGGPAVTRHHHATGILERHNRGAVR
jgi:hypothetical protein